MANYTEAQLDALGELANIGSGTACTALAQMLGRPVDIKIPSVLALPLADAIDAVGEAEAPRTAVKLDIFGDLDGTVLLVFPVEDAATLCGMLGVDPDSEVGLSALGEIGNILGTSYVNALAQMVGMEVEPHPPVTHTDMLGAIVSTVLLERDDAGDTALVLDSAMFVEDEECELSFLLVPSSEGVTDILGRIGM
jgi:chemotaxis protein CheC